MHIEEYVELHVDPQGMELKEHGTPLFPAAFYYDDLNINDVPWHWHDELEAVVVAEGETQVTAGCQHYTLKRGQGFFINGGVLHACYPSGDASCLYHSVVFHPRLVSGGIDTVFWQNYVKPLTASRALESMALTGETQWQREALKAIDRAWVEGATQAPGYEFRVRAALSELTFALFTHLPVDQVRLSEKARRDGDRIKRMLRYIEDHFSENISSVQIADSAAVSVSESLRCFKSTIGMPPIQYLKHYRVQRAAELLTATSEHIGDIAAQCGFQDVSYFTKTFREMKGVTPGEYRRGRSDNY